MSAVFASERAKEQLARILSHVSFPGLGLVLDRDGLVVAAHGGLLGTSVEQVAETFGARREASLTDEPAILGESYRVYERGLSRGYRLIVALPSTVVPRSDHLGRAVDLLERMLAVGALPGPGAPGDSGSGAPARVSLVVEPDKAS